MSCPYADEDCLTCALVQVGNLDIDGDAEVVELGPWFYVRQTKPTRGPLLKVSNGYRVWVTGSLTAPETFGALEHRR